ncbi:tripartite tricarboxylate transporter TctB family protein [Halogeometricum luteum]|uniref:Tripartite tricarboxylate transporter TctB family protein n=1 Tax=Halogeometricum luteum TaxID=2950537 RepID=A0ABU2G3M7_9EURY|nr:tripartite tricarboxylate transporter TctB family protein [Halogeometricum sp. S3BR5-2]MDS0294904.1 tripartite tricarboxylate transporter TctB family protein [Halogeometricum sp. S3BR5-2]
MTDAYDEERRESRDARGVLAATWDQLVLLAVFGYLISVTVQYPDSARRFPLVFLVAGFCFLVVQFSSEVLPPAYGERIKVLTQGMANEMETDREELVDEEGRTESGSVTDDASRAEGPTVEPILTSRTTRSVGIIGLLVVFVGVAYLVGFFYAIPLLILGTVGLLGRRDWRSGIVASLLVMAAIYVLFGQVLHVPVTEGVYELPILGGVL